MRHIALCVAVTLGLFLAVTSGWAAENHVGSVKNNKGQVQVIRKGAALDAQAGMRLLIKDTLRTGQDGSLGVILRDDSILSLGPNSELVLEKFLFVPAQEQLDCNIKLLKGSTIYQSGEIGKLAPEKVHIETPVATIGIRGTRFAVWVGGEK